MSDERGWSPELGVVSIAAPCPARWDKMVGDEAVRFCGLCRLNVYDLSAMTAADARELLLKREGRLCVRFYRRQDGRILTRDCPVGLAARVRRKAWAAFAAALALVVGLLRLRPEPAEPIENGPPPATPIPHAPVVEKSAAPVPDDTWMEARRGLLGPFQAGRSMGRMHSMGVIRHQIVVIKADTK